MRRQAPPEAPPVMCAHPQAPPARRPHLCAHAPVLLVNRQDRFVQRRGLLMRAQTPWVLLQGGSAPLQNGAVTKQARCTHRQSLWVRSPSFPISRLGTQLATKLCFVLELRKMIRETEFLEQVHSQSGDWERGRRRGGADEGDGHRPPLQHTTFSKKLDPGQSAAFCHRLRSGSINTPFIHPTNPPTHHVLFPV